MKDSSRRIFRNMFQLGSGEALARACGVATIILLGHKYGVVLLGVFALAQSLSQYLQPLIDFGLRHVGARLMAVYPQAGNEIVMRVQRRRLLMVGVVLPFILVYTLFARVPVDVKLFLVVFATISGLYVVSLDWAAWGKEDLQLVGFARAIIPASILVFLVLGRGSQHVLWWLVLGNAVGYGLQGAIFWVWWRRHGTAEAVPHDVLATIGQSLAWQRTSIMGLAWLGNLVFNTIDMLMLGVMANPAQVGLYSAAYRVLNQVLITYYLVTQTLYPQFARHGLSDRVRMLKARILLPLLGTGIVLAAILTATRRTLLTLLFGQPFLAAAPLLLLLAWVIPLDFLTSYLSNAYIAWSMERKVLLCTTIAAACNVVLNLIWIPNYGAMAAAVNTLLSYVILLAGLALAGRTRKALSDGPRPQPEFAAR
jgi:O-antigen/teichoic acid export membrane protein